MRTGDKSELALALQDARAETLAWMSALAPEQYIVPQRDTVNPPIWEIGHVGWFQERWCVRQHARSHGDAEQFAVPAIRPSVLADADRWYDSTAVSHQTRWTLDLPTYEETLGYLAQVFDRTLANLDRADGSDEALYFHRLALFHELMHQEAFAYTWHNLGYPAPSVLRPAFASAATHAACARSASLAAPRDVHCAGGPIRLGAERDAGGFVFDNEKWAQSVSVEAFRIDRAPVSNADFLAFVEDDGYVDDGWWDPAGLATLRAHARKAPAHWKCRDGQWFQFAFDTEAPLDPDAAVRQVSAYEAQAWCRWAGRRLPTEAEWVFAAMREDGPARAFRWGDEVWEWTSSPFEPFVGFSADPYAEYSAPWFGTHRVVLGASFATPRAMVDARFRNFYEPHRNDPFIGFRSCAVA